MVVNHYDYDDNKKYYKYVKKEHYPSGQIKLTLLSELKDDVLEITSDFDPVLPQDNTYVVTAISPNSDLEKQLVFIGVFTFYRSMFYTKDRKKYTCCTFETNALNEITN